MSWGYSWRPYVPVAQRRAKAAQFAQRLAKKEGRKLEPVCIDGRKIARTFWGTAWCENLESYSDFENRLPRGRTYVRNGSVIDLQIKTGRLEAIVSGSDVYEVEIEIDRLKNSDWKRIKADCAKSIDSLLDLLAGRLSDGVMTRLTRPNDGLFPQPEEIQISCSCPDWAVLCKHAAAVLYGVGSHLDHRPELLFLLRGVDHKELATEAVAEGNLETALGGSGDNLGSEDLGELFGIELESSVVATPVAKTNGRRKSSGNSKKPRKSRKTRVKKTSARTSSNGQAAKKAKPKKKSAAKKTTARKKTATKKKTVKKKAAKKKAVRKKAGTKKTRSRRKMTSSRKTAGKSRASGKSRRNAARVMKTA